VLGVYMSRRQLFGSAVRFISVGCLVCLSAACSTDSSRFTGSLATSPFTNPFTETTGSVNTPSPSASLSSDVISQGSGYGSGFSNAQSVIQGQSLDQPLQGAVKGIRQRAAMAQPLSSLSDEPHVISAPSGAAGVPIATQVLAPRAKGAASGWNASGGTPVTLGAGETLTTLSNRFGVPVAALMAANGFTSINQASAGQQVIIPAFTGASAKTAAASAPKALNAKPVNPTTAAAPLSLNSQALPKAKVLDKTSLESANIAKKAREEAKRERLAAEKEAKIAREEASREQREAQLSARLEALERKAAAQALAPVPPAAVAVAPSKPVKTAVKAVPKAAIKAPVVIASDDSMYEMIEKDQATQEQAAAQKQAALLNKQQEQQKALKAQEALRAKETLKIQNAQKQEMQKREAKKQEVLKLAEAKKAKEAKIAQAKVVQEKALQEKKVREQLLSEKSAQEKAIAEKAAKVASVQSQAPKAVEKAPEPETTASISREITAKDASDFRWPARGRVISGFSGKGGNEGITMALPEGTPVKSAEGGVVAYAGSELKGYGNLVLVRHDNGFVSAYAHNGELMVKRGEKVKRGQVVAKSGQSGNVSSPQLHFELRKGSTPVDPMQHLTGL
jgi:murein DD-endopeptidase MepM/ murein hydrolase activator NlpD